ncbi:hypothetical protein Leryth_022422 [Lithospermum erythrorhizon]|nr:hypothetical protein Leryth_022422 [Lithospermum erythrorhizon]
MQVQARIEQIKTLKGRVKILKDFQSSCKTRTSRALAQKKDVRVQLISAAKQRSSSKLNDKKTPALCYGPLENPHVAIYQDVLIKFPTTVTRAKWSKKEIENLKKGVKQQFQEKLLQQSVDILNDTEDSSIEGSSLDMIVASIRDCEITPQNMRSFLPKINWEQLASMYVPSRSGMECQSRWLNCEDPLINGNPWTNMEDKNLLHIVQQKGPSNWIDIAISLGTNRTPFQCLARYQRSLNASIIRREWTKEEDIKLQEAVEEYGENNWQVAASFMEGRTGTQCSNRWMKSLHPTRKRVGKWTPEEDKRLKVAVAIFGPKNWCKIAEFVPGRMQAQCRERWANSLDPSLNRGSWTSEEDLLLEKAIQKHGYCWSKVAQCVPNRTDNQCMRRWANLNPEQVPMLRAAKKTKREAMISNFVDRESERPAIGPNDFLQLPAIGPPPRMKRTESVRKRRGRRNRKANFSGDDTSEEVLRITNGSEGEDGQEVGTSVTQVRRSSRRRKRKVFTEEDDDLKAIRDSVGRNSKLKLKSNKKKNLPIAKYENPDNIESTDSFISVAPKRHNCKRPKLKDVACSPENHEAVEDDDMTLASFLGRSFGAKRLSHSVEPAETVSASAYVDSTALVDENASVVGISRPNRLITMEEMSSDQMQVDESGDDLPLSYFCTKLKDTVSASAKVDAFAQVDENASAAGVSVPKKTKKPKRLSIMEELSSDQMLVDDSGDDLPLSRFRKKLKDTRARVVEEADAETVSASAEVDSAVQVDENSSAAAVIQPKRLSTMEERSPDPMQIEESGDDLPLSRFCKKVKDSHANTEDGPDNMTFTHFYKRLKRRKC